MFAEQRKGFSPASEPHQRGVIHLKQQHALQIILDLCIPEKELAKTRSQISFIYFQSHS